MSNIPVRPPADLCPKFVDYRDPIWGDSYTWAFERALSAIRKIVVHHTVTPRSATPMDIALLHKARGWGGIGYHFVITEDGTIYYCGDIGTGRANVLNVNDMIIGIALPGDFTKEDPTDAQLKSLRGLCLFLLFHSPNLPNIKDWGDVIGHKEAVNFWPSAGGTACPGNRWKEGMNMYHRITNGPGWDGTTPTPAPGGADNMTEEEHNVRALEAYYKASGAPNPRQLAIDRVLGGSNFAEVITGDLKHYLNNEQYNLRALEEYAEAQGFPEGPRQYALDRWLGGSNFKEVINGDIDAMHERINQLENRPVTPSNPQDVADLELGRAVRQLLDTKK